MVLVWESLQGTEILISFLMFCAKGRNYIAEAAVISQESNFVDERNGYKIHPLKYMF
jgi:hypothetical protein